MSNCRIVKFALVLSLGFGIQSLAQQAPQIASMNNDAPAIPANASSSASDDAPAAAAVVAVPQPISVKKKKDSGEEIRITPFSRIAIGDKLGTLGWGGQIATPITRWLNLRGGADFFNFGYALTNSGSNYDASLHMKSGTAQADYYPFRHASFHISPGVLIFKTNLSATMNVPGGSTFTENDTDYTSDPNDPVNGSGVVTFSRTVMPMFTLGFGNMIPRRESKHWSAPFEIGAAYTGAYAMQINLNGSVCQQGYCQSVNDPSVLQNVQAEQAKINEEVKKYKILPIITTGVAYRF